jgi:NADH:ubiquinone oxidoreductase subunit 6 (subunit J)
MPFPLLSATSFTWAEFWPIVLPILSGGLAIFYLLPRPRAYPKAIGAGLGLLALLLTAILLVPARPAIPEAVAEAILFYAFSFLAIVSGALLVTQHNPARAALSFALVVLSTCGIFLLLAAPFLMAATIIIYAGAIVVTFLFVLMLAQQLGRSDADARSREPMLVTVTGFILLGALIYVLQLSYGTRDLDGLIDRLQAAAALDDPQAILDRVGSVGEKGDLFRACKETFGRHGLQKLKDQVEEEQTRWPVDDAAKVATVATLREGLDRMVHLAEQGRSQLGSLQPPGPRPLSPLSGPTAAEPLQNLRRNAGGVPQLPAENSAYLGKSLFTDFLLPVELGGVLLLVAAIGAIAIAHRRTTNERAS